MIKSVPSPVTLSFDGAIEVKHPMWRHFEFTPVGFTFADSIFSMQDKVDIHAAESGFFHAAMVFGETSGYLGFIFMEKIQKDAFFAVLRAPGVGAKKAASIISALDVSDYAVLNTGDPTPLLKCKGIKAKTAKKIVDNVKKWPV